MNTILGRVQLYKHKRGESSVFLWWTCVLDAHTTSMYIYSILGCDVTVISPLMYVFATMPAMTFPSLRVKKQ